MYRVVKYLAFLVLLIAAGCGNETEGTETFEGGQMIWVNSKLVDCEGEGPQKCMQIKDSENGKWQNFYGNIARFTYEEGNFYTLRVRISEVANPPAGGSSLRYEMLELVSQRPDPALRAYKARPDLYEMYWRLKSYTKPNGDVVRVDNNLVVTMEVDGSTDRVSGIAACNNYFGQANINGNDISFSDLGTTRKECPESGAMELENLYLSMLGDVVGIKPAKSVFMTMLTSDGGSLLFIPSGKKEG